MRSWRVWLGSFWAHVEIMWCHCGHLGRTWGTWRAILEDLAQQEAKRWSKKPRGSPKVRIGGTEGRQGATRGDKDLGRRRRGGKRGI